VQRERELLALKRAQLAAACGDNGGSGGGDGSSAPTPSTAASPSQPTTGLTSGTLTSGVAAPQPTLKGGKSRVGLSTAASKLRRQAFPLTTRSRFTDMLMPLPWDDLTCLFRPTKRVRPPASSRGAGATSGGAGGGSGASGACNGASGYTSSIDIATATALASSKRLAGPDVLSSVPSRPIPWSEVAQMFQCVESGTATAVRSPSRRSPRRGSSSPKPASSPRSGAHRRRSTSGSSSGAGAGARTGAGTGAGAARVGAHANGAASPCATPTKVRDAALASPPSTPCRAPRTPARFTSSPPRTPSPASSTASQAGDRDMDGSQPQPHPQSWRDQYGGMSKLLMSPNTSVRVAASAAQTPTSDRRGRASGSNAAAAGSETSGPGAGGGGAGGSAESRGGLGPRARPRMDSVASHGSVGVGAAVAPSAAGAVAISLRPYQPGVPQVSLPTGGAGGASSAAATPCSSMSRPTHLPHPHHQAAAASQQPGLSIGADMASAASPPPPLGVVITPMFRLLPSTYTGAPFQRPLSAWDTFNPDSPPAPSPSPRSTVSQSPSSSSSPRATSGAPAPAASVASVSASASASASAASASASASALVPPVVPSPKSGTSKGKRRGRKPKARPSTVAEGSSSEVRYLKGVLCCAHYTMNVL